MEDMEAMAKQLMHNPVDPYILEPHISLTSDAPAVKALALMEQSDTSYIFVVDEGQYKGVITIQGLARMLTQLDERH
jgi:CBS domain-containing protein